jgi:hypothetical protein
MRKKLSATEGKSVPPEIKPGATVFGAWIAGGTDSDLMMTYWQNPGEEPEAWLRVKDTGKGKKWYEITPTKSREENLATFDELIDRLITTYCGEGATSQRIRNISCDDLLEWYRTLATQGFINLTIEREG